jgi:hypothetical protein
MSNNSRSVRAMPSSRSFSMRMPLIVQRAPAPQRAWTPHTSQPTVPPGTSVMSVSVPPRARASQSSPSITALGWGDARCQVPYGGAGAPGVSW